jgi:DNA polymerase zeta
MYVKPEVRDGLLPKMLREILKTRVLLKKSMRLHSESAATTRSLNAQQFALKMIANVTYGYTSASFSGRMPMAELADSIVQTARETLEDAITLIESTPDWHARVVYGDTDSIFVELPGRSRAEAFEVGQEIVRAVTGRNPDPIKLQFEKVFHPCFLVSKKRYVGYSWEKPTSSKPVLLSKGIEVVRRDSCSIVQDCMSGALRALFDSKDHNVEAVKSFLFQYVKSMRYMTVGYEKYVFAKEVRLGTYAGVTLPPAAVVALRVRKERNIRYKYGERVPFLVCCGPPEVRLIDKAYHPLEFAEAEGALRIDVDYYLEKQIIPSLERVLALCPGCDIRRWFAEWQGMTTRSHFATHRIFGGRGDPEVDPSLLRSAASEWVGLMEKCIDCAGCVAAAESCQNIDCSTWWKRVKCRELARLTW